MDSKSRFIFKKDLWFEKDPKLVEEATMHALSLMPRFGRNDSLLRQLLSKSFWPEAAYIHKPVFKDMQPNRNLQYLKHRCGDFFSKKQNRYVQYQSALAGAFFMMLEKSDDVVWYLEQPVRVNYFKGRERAIHVPDVLVCLQHNRYAIVDIKPLEVMSDPSNDDLYFALRGYCIAVGWGLLVTDCQFSFFELTQHKLPLLFHNAMSTRLAQGPLNYQDYRKIESHYGASKIDFAAFVVQEKMEHSARPFRLALRPQGTCRT